MAISTKCQTPGAVFHTTISHHAVTCCVEFYELDLDLTAEEAGELEANIHNMLELVLKPYFANK